MASPQNASVTVNLSGLVFLVLLVLKLSGTGPVAGWSWWIITLPFTLPLLLIAAVLVVCGLGAVLQQLFK